MREGAEEEDEEVEEMLAAQLGQSAAPASVDGRRIMFKRL